jgi:hypothetical protein
MIDPHAPAGLTPGRPWPVSAYQYPLNPSKRGPVYVPPPPEREDCAMCRFLGWAFVVATFILAILIIAGVIDHYTHTAP